MYPLRPKKDEKTSASCKQNKQLFIFNLTYATSTDNVEIWETLNQILVQHGLLEYEDQDAVGCVFLCHI